MSRSEPGSTEGGGPPSDDLVTLLRSGDAPRQVRAFAARSALPLDPDDSIRALLAVVEDPDPEIMAAARAGLQEIPPDLLARFVRDGRASPAELDLLAHESEDPFVLEEIVRARGVGDETLLFVARTATGRPQEALVANQARLLSHPDLVEALFENPGLSADGRRLLLELREEFFEKEERRKEAARAREARAAETVESEEEPATGEADTELDDELFIDDGGEAEPEPPPSADDDGSLFIGAIYKRIGLMNVSEKIKLAYTGSKEERRVLIGDTNKLIGIAVLKSRSLTVNEVESFAGMRNLDEEVYRKIAQNREWMRKPAVVLTLVRNPRAPIDLTLPLLKQLPVRELRVIFRDRNLAPVLRQTARRFMVLKRR